MANNRQILSLDKPDMDLDSLAAAIENFLGRSLNDSLGPDAITQGFIFKFDVKLILC